MMDTPFPSPPPPARGGAGLLAAFIVGATVLGAASMMDPTRSRAGVEVTPGRETRPTSAGAPAVVETRVVLGQLVGREHLVKIYAGAAGPRYTVSTPDGQILREDLSATDAIRLFPALKLEGLISDPTDAPAGTPLMSAEPLGG
ncbi:MAG: hypothetical protein JNM07_03535 [Phycisphaerae bacterium]|nr:hypothetical protein [Phycisphaerae bacterium]